MDGNSAKKAPVLDHLVSTNGALSGHSAPTPPSQIGVKPVSSTNGVNQQSGNQPEQSNISDAGNLPQNRRTDKSQFEIELTNTVNQIMLKHFEHASEQIVQQVLSEVRARLPGKRKT